MKRLRLHTTAVVLGVSLLSSPLALHASGEVISEIRFEGNQKIKSEDIAKTLQLKVGGKLSESELNSDIKALYSQGLFRDIEVNTEKTSKGLKLIFVLVEKPSIQKITIKGNKEIDEDELREALLVKPMQMLDEKKIGESKEKIKELYKKQGLGLALISNEVEIDPNHPNEAELIFTIQENKNLKVEKITFEGNKVFSDFKLKRFLKTKEKGLFSFLSGSGKYKEEAIERDVAFLNYQYLNQGYIKAEVSKPELIALPNKKGMELKFKIKEGDRYKIRKVSVNGDILTTQEEIISKLNTLQGNYYSQQVMESDLSRLAEVYGNQGYAFANILPKPYPDDSSKEVDIEFSIEKGKKISIEKINITGNTVTRDKVIRRELKVTENSLYNETLIRQSKARVEGLGYFENVEFSTPRGSSDDKMVLNIHVKEKSTGSFSVGAGYSTVESFIFTASINKQNFLGLGVSGSLLAEFSKRRQQFSLQYYDRYFLDSRWIFSASGYKLLTSYDEFDRDALGGEVNLGHQIFDNSSVSLGYRFEKVKVDHFSAIVPDFFKVNTSGLTSSLLFNLERDTRNNKMFATSGSYNQFSLEYSGLGASNRFLRLDAVSRWFFPIPFLKGSSIKANARVGYIKSLEDNPVPLFDRYFTGGINSMRGFSPRTIGPALQIPTGPTTPDVKFVYGGNKQLIFNVEYEFPIYEAAGFRGVVFADAGNAFAENETLNPIKLRSNYGFGLRWISPFGPLRFEWGLPFKPKAGEDKIVFNFTIGSFF